jgi:hypothetical protein
MPRLTAHCKLRLLFGFHATSVQANPNEKKALIVTGKRASPL